MPKERQAASWNAEAYGKTARFVSDHGALLLDMLDPKPGERILDLGCGDGALTEKIAAAGAEVIGVDASESMVAAARERGIDARLISAYELPFQEEFDAVFSNAALHWMLEPDSVVERVAQSLKAGGRFAAEFGGTGNVQKIAAALAEALKSHGVKYEEVSPWYFPAPEEYGEILEQNGFVIDSIALIPRPTPIESDIRDWLDNFAGGMLNAIPAAHRQSAIERIRGLLKPDLCDAAGCWTIDYIRLRVAARKTPAAG